ncbi:MAG: signal peptide peptidase SppA [Pyrinomonadaceae bacterium]
MSKTSKALIIAATVCVVLVLLLGIGVAVVAEIFRAKSIPQNSVLVLRVEGALEDYAPKDSMASALGINQSDSFRDLLNQLKKAKADKRIGGVLLDINFPQMGWGKAQELRNAIKEVRAGGKPVYAYLELGMTKDYYIATAAEKIYMPPAGDLYATGFSANATFYKGSLDKIGIEPEVIQIGKYKNAPDSYTRTDMSDEQREVLNAIVDQYYGSFVNAVAEARKKSVEEVKEIVDSAPFHGKLAQDAGLTDGAIYKEQVYNEFKKRLGFNEKDKLPQVTSAEYENVSPESLGLNKGERLAVVYVSGTINMGSSSSSPLGESFAGSDTIVESINDAAEDDSIKAIILRVDSPGGSSLASDLIWNAIEQAKTKKPVVVSMADLAASGGYYISCNANKIVAEPNTLTGSIGVFLGKPVLKGFYDWVGISTENVQRGKNAGLFREDVKWTDEERAKMQEQANQVYFTDFVPKVAKGRNMDVEKVNSLGQGHVWTGTQAKENGLVDEIGGIDVAIKEAMKLAKIPESNQVKLVLFPPPVSLFEAYFGSSHAASQMDAAEAKIIKNIPPQIRNSLRRAAMFERMKNGETMLMMPFELEVK